MSRSTFKGRNDTWSNARHDAGGLVDGALERSDEPLYSPCVGQHNAGLDCEPQAVIDIVREP